MATAEGKHGPMPFDVFEKLVRDGAKKPVSIHYSKQGALAGLPPDVVTVVIGDPDKTTENDEPGSVCWWNVRKGEIPEESVYTIEPGHLTEDEEIQLMSLKAGLGLEDPEVPMVYRSANKQAAQRRISRLEGYKADKKRLRYVGWRSTLVSMLRTGYLDLTPEIENWLGYLEVDSAKRRDVLDNVNLSAAVKRDAKVAQGG